MENAWTLKLELTRPSGIDMEQTGKKMKELCRRHEVTVEMIKSELQIGSFQSVYAWFAGKTLPSLDNLYRLSEMLKMPMDDLVVGIEKELSLFVYMERTQADRMGRNVAMYCKICERKKRCLWKIIQEADAKGIVVT